MAELTQQERLQPSLLDRLTDNEPERRQESREKRVLSMRKLRESVLRDLGWLLNTGNLAPVEDLSDCPEVANSVLNYGVRDLSGGAVAGMDLGALERAVRQAIWDFEPRILRDSVKVRARRSEKEMSNRALSFEIEGQLWAQPLPLHLFVRTEIDLESGEVTIAGHTTG